MRVCGAVDPTAQLCFRAVEIAEDGVNVANPTPLTDFFRVGGPGELMAVIDNLDHSTFYQFYVRACNAVGKGPESPPSAFARTLGSPSGACSRLLPLLRRV